MAALKVGYYGLPSVVNFDMKSALRRIEEWLLPRKGAKSFEGIATYFEVRCLAFDTTM